ncbi:KH domain-containing protein [Candidatus Woesearchaeota archaeon]|nr:KH domain-containing protein [Candidatus Woesearchaeota archaeon]
MEEYIHQLKIPRQRIAVLIGKKGETKAMLEGHTNTKINIDSEEGDVTISGTDTIAVYKTSEIIKAIGRGFNPETALQLLKQDCCFDIINIADFVKRKHHMQRLKGRVIGSDGRARKNIEELTETEICVFGKTISIIGEIEKVAIARRAIESLLAGSMHSTVYRWLEKNKRDMKMRDMA